MEVFLKQILSEHFNSEELDTMLFELEVDYERFNNLSKESKCREIVNFFARNSNLNILINKVSSDNLKIFFYTPFTNGNNLNSVSHLISKQIWGFDV